MADDAVAAAPGEESAPLPQGPPIDEPGFPSLPMFGAEINELFGGCAPQQMAMVMLGLSDRMSLQGMGMLGAQPQGQIGTAYASRFGVLKAEMVSAGVLQTSLEGFQPLPLPLQLNTQLAFMPQGLAMGAVQGVLMTPVGVALGNLNLAGQMSAEIVTGFEPAEGNQVLLGAHAWGLPGQLGGVKTAIEWQRMVMEGDDLVRSCAVTLACTRPLHEDKRDAPANVSLSVMQRMSPTTQLAFGMERNVEGGAHAMSIGGSRQLEGGNKVRAKWTTSGLLGIALEVVSEKTSLTLSTEVDSTPGKALCPKFGAVLSLNA